MSTLGWAAAGVIVPQSRVGSLKLSSDSNKVVVTPHNISWRDKGKVAMASPDTTQKLRAVFVTDVVGYSRLMADDPHGTVESLAACREVFASRIEQFQGRVVNAPGDSILAEFESVVDAVNCAVAVQRELHARNEGLPDERRMDFRIGVNLGDVLVRDGELFGDGVNIAARLEALAEPGGVCISRTVYDQVKSRLELEYEYLGEQQVKNIAEPVRAYRVRIGEGEIAPPAQPSAGRAKPRRKRVLLAAAVVIIAVAGGWLAWDSYQENQLQAAVAALKEEAKLPLPEKPSIAVLAFENLSSDPEQEYFSDGIAENLITHLSKVPHLLVIARNSSFSYKGKAVKVRQIGRDLGVRYVLEGSVQKVGDRVRINAQLIDAATGNHVWAERYDRELRDIFAVQDEIVHKLLTEIAVKLIAGEGDRGWFTPPANLEAFDLYLQASNKFTIGEIGSAEKLAARGLIAKAVALDPDWAEAHAMMGAHYILPVYGYYSRNPREDMALGISALKRALQLDPSNNIAHLMMGIALYIRRQYDQAFQSFERAVNLNPNSSYANFVLGGALVYSGLPEKGIQATKRGMRLDPYTSPGWNYFLGLAYLRTGRHEEALQAAGRIIQGTRKKLGFTLSAFTYADTDRMEEARDMFEKSNAIRPFLPISKYRQVSRFKNPEDLEFFIGLMRKLGVPEN